MGKYLQILKNLLGGGITSLIKTGIFLIVWILGLQEVVGYEPGSIAGKYSSGLIGSLPYESWIKRWGDLYGSGAARQNIVPSAMVDGKGDLYTLVLDYFYTGSRGPDFHLTKFYWNGTNVSRGKTKCIDAWREWHGSSLNIKDTPNLPLDQDAMYFREYFPNVLHSCICQDLYEDSEYIVVNFYVPALRFANVTDTEGIYTQVLRKSDFSVYTTEKYHGHDKDNQFSFNHLKPRRYNTSWNYGVPTNFLSGANNRNINYNLFFPGLRKTNGYDSGGIYNLKTLCCEGNYNSSGIAIESRYIKFGSSCYGLCCWAGNYWVLLFSFDPTTYWKSFQSYNDWYGLYKKMTEGSSDYDHYTPYHYDFCIVKAPDGTGVACVLGLRRCDASTNSYTALSEKSNFRWNATSINWWRSTDTCLILTSSKLGTTPSSSYSDDPQNMIYTTGGIWSHALSCSHGLYGTYGLYDNTHKCCVYMSSTGSQYIIYCYCYPGMKKRLYLGYAMCSVDKDYKVQLGTKYEFRANSSQWSESFSNLNSCSRIISMDCRNGHLWITWVNADDSEYYYFHICAKDLVGE